MKHLNVRGGGSVHGLVQSNSVYPYFVFLPFFHSLMQNFKNGFVSTAIYMDLLRTLCLLFYRHHG